MPMLRQHRQAYSAAFLVDFSVKKRSPFCVYFRQHSRISRSADLDCSNLLLASLDDRPLAQFR
jgi:hypothetical protein